MYNNLEKLTILLREKKLTLGIAESCTGGLLSAALTELPKSSEYLREGLVTYSIDSKILRLGISKESIAEYGVVSEYVAKAMAEQVRKYLDNDIGIGITGNAGPTVNQVGTPVGLVYIGLSTKFFTECHSYNFKGNRTEIRNKAVVEAINVLLDSLERL
jgi:nicotinamide-nucleotide amidase